jgi:DNA (cytosine-5)-methyltransferase 1
MLELGYDGQIVYFNSQFALPTPQSRDRMYVVFWRRGLPAPNLDFRPPSWCSSCETVVRGVQTWKPRVAERADAAGHVRVGPLRAQYLYACPTASQPVAPAVVGARTIDRLVLPMERIGDKSEAARRRRRASGSRRPRAARRTLDPVAVQVGGNLFERRPGVRVWSVNDPLRTVVGTSQLALVVRYGGQSAVAARARTSRCTTLTAHDRQVGLVIPNREHNVGGALDEPVGAVTTGNRHMLVQVNRSTRGKPLDRTRRPRRADPHDRRARRARARLVPAQRRRSPSTSRTRTVYGGGAPRPARLQRRARLRPRARRCRRHRHRPRQAVAPRAVQPTGVARDTREPMGTLTTKDRQALVITEATSTLPVPDAAVARAAARAADARARRRPPYELTARRRDRRGKMKELSNEQRVKMIGNAVSSPVATMLGMTVVAEDDRFVYVKRSDCSRRALASAAGAYIVARSEFAAWTEVPQ